jgi:6-pyruvoyltetrahydropterin/6-carboxytetrahydropterin synthase
MKRIAKRYHDFSYGHRVYNHESKCAHLHGHNGRVTFYCASDELDSVGRVIDFSVIKYLLCDWLEQEWDHKMLIWENDPWAESLLLIDPSVVVLPFNPTAENLAEYLLTVIGPTQLKNTNVILDKVEFEETRKCSAAIENTE